MSKTIQFHRHARQRIDRAVHAGFAALADDPGAVAAYARLIHHVRTCSRLLRGPTATTAARALANLARHHRAFRPGGPGGQAPADIAAWPGGVDEVHAAVHSLAHHLLARYPVPAAMTSVWFGDGEPCVEEQRWWIAHAGGRRFRDIDGLPVRLTRRMEHILLTSSPQLPLRAALRRAELLGLGAPPELVDELLTTDLAADLGHGEFWRGVFHFFIHHWDALGRTPIKPMVDFLYAVRLRPCEVVTPRGPEVLPPPQPDFSIAGRTPQSLQRLVDQWHHELGRRRHAGRAWPASGIGGYHYFEPLPDDGGDPVHWRLEELLHSSELRDEGHALRHCVASYEWRCHRGISSIWSLRRQSGERPAEPRYTVEVERQTRRIVQIRGHCNRRADGLPRRLIGQWAHIQQLALAEHA